MTWMLIRLVLSLAFVGLVLWFAARVAKKRGLGGGGAHGVIEVVARQRMGRASSVNVVRIGDVVLVVGATEEHVTLLAEIDNETIDVALGDREHGRASRLAPHTDDYDDDHDQDGRPTGGQHRTVVTPRASSGALAGSVFDKNGWGGFVNHMRERTVRRP
jgi:flagellar protein FliO/FliZ